MAVIFIERRLISAIDLLKVLLVSYLCMKSLMKSWMMKYYAASCTSFPNSKQCQINTANRFTTTRMHEWCEKAPLTAVERVATFR